MKLVTYSLWVLVLVGILSGCPPVAWKSAAASTASSVVVSATEQSDSVIVMDLTKRQPNSPSDRKPTGFGRGVPPNSTPHITKFTKPTELTNEDEKDNTLLWFFFSMMIMGMVGASIIGIIEAVQNKNNAQKNS